MANYKVISCYSTKYFTNSISPEPRSIYQSVSPTETIPPQLRQQVRNDHQQLIQIRQHLAESTQKINRMKSQVKVMKQTFGLRARLIAKFKSEFLRNLVALFLLASPEKGTQLYKAKQELKCLNVSQGQLQNQEIQLNQRIDSTLHHYLLQNSPTYNNTQIQQAEFRKNLLDQHVYSLRNASLRLNDARSVEQREAYYHHRKGLSHLSNLLTKSTIHGVEALVNSHDRLRVSFPEVLAEANSVISAIRTQLQALKQAARFDQVWDAIGPGFYDYGSHKVLKAMDQLHDLLEAYSVGVDHVNQQVQGTFWVIQQNRLLELDDLKKSIIG